MAWRFGDEFFRRYVIEGNVWYVTHPYSYRQPNYFFYVRTYLGAFAPWGFLVLARVLDLARTRGGTADRREWLLFCWIGAVFGVFTLARFKLDHYIYPAAPALCLIASRAWAVARDREPSGFFQRTAVLAKPVVLIAAAAVLTVLMFELDLPLSPDAVVFPLAMIAGATVCAFRIWRHGWSAPAFPTALIATLVATYMSVATFGFPALERARPTATLGQWIDRRQPSASPVGVFQLGEFEASLRFYSNRRVVLLNDVDALRAFVARPGPRSVIMRRKHFLAMEGMGVPVRFGFQSDAVVGRTGKGLRRQQWGRVIVTVKDDASAR